MSNHADSPSDEVKEDQRLKAKWTPLVFALMTIALLLRIVAAILIDRQTHSMGQSFLIEGDANGYWELGQKIAAGEAYSLYTPPRQVLRVPGFPLLIAASMKLFGDNIFAARIVLAVIGTGCCWLTYQLGQMLHTRRVGFWAAMFVAINPLHIGNSVLILSETWFTFWMLLSLIGLVWLIDGQAPSDVEKGQFCRWRLIRKSGLAGTLIGVTTLIRPGFLPWLVVACAAVILLLRNHHEGTDTSDENVAPVPSQRAPIGIRLITCAALVAGCLVVMLPWAARNAGVTGHWVFTSLWSGPSLYDGLNPDANGASNMQFFEDDFVMEHMSEFEMNQHYKRKAVQYALQNPGRAVSLGLQKAAIFLSPVPNFAKQRGWATITVCVACWSFLLVCCVIGLRIREWDAIGLIVMTGPLVLFLLVHMVFVSSVRYRLPLEFPLSVLGAIGWCSLLLKRGQHSQSPGEKTLDGERL